MFPARFCQPAGTGAGTGICGATRLAIYGQQKLKLLMALLSAPRDPERRALEDGPRWCPNAWVMPTRPAVDSRLERGGRLVSTPGGHTHLTPSAVNVRPGRRLVSGRGAQRSEPSLMHLHDSMAGLRRYCPTFPHIRGLWPPARDDGFPKRRCAVRRYLLCVLNWLLNV